ncbi:serine hydrolase domain-containing protein [Dinoroseobacter sp. S76]|uniref:serine hydrolase domain-containing protein n=1 Tax=Dinoroseobacter sp. S76 TaxID=3415124 RepID=UPI003C7D148F
MNGKPAADPAQEFIQSGIRMRNGGKTMVLMAALRISLGLVVILVLLGLSLYAVAIKPPRAPQGDMSRDEVTSYIENVIASRAATAMSVAVIRDGEVIWEHAAGQANPFEDRAATTTSVYHVWSVTKVATALAVLALAEDGLLDLDAPVADLLPWFEVEQSEGRAMTVRDLLRHTSGLRDTVPAVFGWLRYDEDLPNQTEYLRSRMPDYTTLKFSPGEDRRYSNLGYMVLGAVIEAITGETYENVVRKRVLAPAGMTTTDFVFNPDIAPDEVLGSHPAIHVFSPLLPFMINMRDFVQARQGQLLWLNRLYVEATPPTGLISSARDAALLADAAMRGGVLVGTDAMDLMVPATDQDVPLGWFETGGETRRWLQHRGGGPGHAAAVRIYPDENLAIAVLASGTAAPAADVADLIAKAFPFTGNTES